MAASDESEPRGGADGAAPTPEAPAGVAGRRPSRLWIWFVAAFALQLAAWAVWLTIAAQHRVQEVPVAPSR